MDVSLCLISLYYFFDMDERMYIFKVDLENRSICSPNFFKIKKANTQKTKTFVYTNNTLL